MKPDNSEFPFLTAKICSQSLNFRYKLNSHLLLTIFKLCQVNNKNTKMSKLSACEIKSKKKYFFNLEIRAKQYFVQFAFFPIPGKRRRRMWGKNSPPAENKPTTSTPTPTPTLTSTISFSEPSPKERFILLEELIEWKWGTWKSQRQLKVRH